jgi:hypothetical protein
MMKVKGTETTSREVNISISPRDVFTSLRTEVFSKLKLPSYDVPFIKDGKILVEEEEHGHTTSWSTKVLFEVPSANQLDAIKTFEMLNTLMQKLEIK